MIREKTIKLESGDQYRIEQSISPSQSSYPIKVYLNGRYVGDRNNKSALRKIIESKGYPIDLINSRGNIKITQQLGRDLLNYLDSID